MFKQKLVSLIIPCKNEARAIADTLMAIPGCIDEILVINNGSTDKTAAVAKQLGARVIQENRQKNGIGYGFAHMRGIQEAKGDIIVCLDGDGSYPVHKIPAIISELEKKNLDFISCNRLPFENPKKMSYIRKLGVVILNTTFGLLFSYRIQDSLSGMWVFRSNILADMPLTEGGWNFSLEIKLRAIQNKNIRFAEYHIPYHDRQFDSSKQNLFQTGFQHMLFLFTMRLLPQRNVMKVKSMTYEKSY